MKYIKYIVLMVLMMPILVSAKSNYSLEVIKEAADTLYLENDHGYISKRIVSVDEENNQIGIEVKVKNERQNSIPATEIVLLIDNSPSMDYVATDGSTRRELITEASKELVNKLFDKYTNIKIGVVKFSSELGTSYENLGYTIMTTPTSNKEDVLTELTNIATVNYGENGTNIQTALWGAKEAFSNTEGNKIIILLTDGLPDSDENLHAIPNSQMVLTNERYIEILANTKKELINIANSDIKLITLLTGVTNEDFLHSNDDFVAVERLFGTPEEPTAGIFYNIRTTDISSVIRESINNDIVNMLERPLSSIKLTDFFPKNIIDNFQILNSNGEPLEDFNTNDNSLSANENSIIDGEDIVLYYVLQLNEDFDESIINTNLATNNLVNLVYTDEESNEVSATLNSSPVIRIVVKEETNSTPPIDNNESPKPNTNINTDSEVSNETITNPETSDSTAFSAILCLLSILSLTICMKTLRKRII